MLCRDIVTREFLLELISSDGLDNNKDNVYELIKEYEDDIYDE